MRARVLAAAVLFAAVGGLVRADDKALERLDLDTRIVKTVYEAALLGTEVFNKGKHEECFRLYQGTLSAVYPLLDHRPKLAATVKAKMEKANGMKAAEGAFVLREALDEIQHTIAPSPKADPKEPKVEPKKTTLWDRLGGEPGVKKAIDDVIALSIEDPAVNLLRSGKFKLDAKGMAAFKHKLLEMVSETTGGPLKYEGKDMKSAHAGMKITEKEFDAFAAHIVTALKKQKIAQDDIDAVMKIVGGTKKDIVEGKGN